MRPSKNGGITERTRNMILAALILRCPELRYKLTTAIGAPQTSEALRRASTLSGNWWYSEKYFTGSSALDQALVGYDRGSGVGDDYTPMIQTLDGPELRGLIEEVLEWMP